MGIALGQEPSELLKWFVQSCSQEFASLQANADNVEKYFVNGLMGTADAEEDVEMSLNASNATIPSCAQDVIMEDADAVNPVSTPHSGPSSPVADTLFPEQANQSADGEVTPECIPAQLTTPELTPGALSSTRARSNSLIPAGDAQGPVPGSPESSLTSLSDDEREDNPAADTPAAHAAPLTLKSSGRLITPAAKFTSGVTLTQAPAPKKRKLEPENPLLMGPMTVAEKEEELYWSTAFAHVTAVVSLLRHSLQSTW